MDIKVDEFIMIEINKIIKDLSQYRTTCYLNNNNIVLMVDNIKIIRGRTNLYTEFYLNHSPIMKINEKGYLTSIASMSKALVMLHYISSNFSIEIKNTKKFIVERQQDINSLAL